MHDRARRSPDAPTLALMAIVGAYAGYLAFAIWHSSYVVEGQRYFSLFDDAMISMRYARNLAEGHGLVWNAGLQHVEGFTNLLWTMYMAGLHLLPIPVSKISLAVQITGAVCALLTVIMTYLLARRISGPSRIAPLGAALTTAAFWPLAFWTVLGMEVGLITVSILTATYLSVRATQNQRFSWWPLIVAGALTMVRLDLVLSASAIVVYLVLANRHLALRYLAAGTLVLGIFLISQEAFRFVYYGNLLPNTYYLKVSGVPLDVRLKAGGYYALLLGSRLSPVLLIAAAFGILRVVLRRDINVGLLGTLVAIAFVYSIYVGGDAWETYGANRFITPIMPLVFVLSWGGLAFLVQRWSGKPRQGAGNQRKAGLDPRRMVLVGLFMVAMALLVSVHQGWQSVRWLVRDGIPSDIVGDNRQSTQAALVLNSVAEPGSRVAVARAGVLPYFAPAMTFIDMLGKSDIIIAHGPYRELPIEGPFGLGYRAGHNKWDLEESIGSNHPDIVADFVYGQEAEFLATGVSAPYVKASFNRGGESRVSIYVRNRAATSASHNGTTEPVEHQVSIGELGRATCHLQAAEGTWAG